MSCFTEISKDDLINSIYVVHCIKTISELWRWYGHAIYVKSVNFFSDFFSNSRKLGLRNQLCNISIERTAQLSRPSYRFLGSHRHFLPAVLWTPVSSGLSGTASPPSGSSFDTSSLPPFSSSPTPSIVFSPPWLVFDIAYQGIHVNLFHLG